MPNPYQRREVKVIEAPTPGQLWRRAMEHIGVAVEPGMEPPREYPKVRAGDTSHHPLVLTLRAHLGDETARVSTYHVNGEVWGVAFSDAEPPYRAAIVRVPSS